MGLTLHLWDRLFKKAEDACRGFVVVHENSAILQQPNRLIFWSSPRISLYKELSNHCRYYLFHSAILVGIAPWMPLALFLAPDCGSFGVVRASITSWEVKDKASGFFSSSPARTVGRWGGGGAAKSWGHIDGGKPEKDPLIIPSFKEIQDFMNPNIPSLKNHFSL